MKSNSVCAHSRPTTSETGAQLLGVVLALCNAFGLLGTAGGFLRFNVARSLDDRVPGTIEAAMRGHHLVAPEVTASLPTLHAIEDGPA